MKRQHARTPACQPWFTLKYTAPLSTHAHRHCPNSASTVPAGSETHWGTTLSPCSAGSGGPTWARWVASPALQGVDSSAPSSQLQRRQTWATNSAFLSPSHAAFDEGNGGKAQKVNFSPPEIQVPPKPCSLAPEPLVTPTPRRRGVLIFNHQAPGRVFWGLWAAPPTDTHEDPRN